MDRYHFNAIVTDQDAADTYLPAFQSCVEVGKASGIMCSYNAVNGIPSCANTEMLTNKARGEWGFDGYITSDCGAVSCVIDDHHYTNTSDETCSVVLNAGMVCICPSGGGGGRRRCASCCCLLLLIAACCCLLLPVIVVVVVICVVALQPLVTLEPTCLWCSCDAGTDRTLTVARTSTATCWTL